MVYRRRVPRTTDSSSHEQKTTLPFLQRSCKLQKLTFFFSFSFCCCLGLELSSSSIDAILLNFCVLSLTLTVCLSLPSSTCSVPFTLPLKFSVLFNASVDRIFSALRLLGGACGVLDVSDAMETLEEMRETLSKDTLGEGVGGGGGR